MNPQPWDGNPETAPDTTDPHTGTIIYDPTHGPNCTACTARRAHEPGPFGAITPRPAATR